MKPSIAPDRPVCFVGYMAGSTPGYTTSQGYVLSEILRSKGWPIVTVSRKHNRWLRLLEITSLLFANGRRFEAIAIEVYSGRNFILVDIASAVAAWSGKPIVMVLHGGLLPQFFERYPSWSHRVLKRATALVAPSCFLARAAKETLTLDAQVIPNVIDITRYRNRKRDRFKPNLLWMRAFADIYNPTMAVRVFERVKARYPGARMVMAGRDMGQFEAIRLMASMRSLNDSITFPGFLSGSSKATAFETCDVFINTNNVDNMPVAVVEACASGLAVVSTAVGGMRDLLTDGSNSLLVAADDDESMARSIFRLIEEPGLGTRLTTCARELALASSLESVLPRWEHLFVSCTGAQS